MHSKQRPIGVDLFAGAGGITLGFEQAGFDILAAVELDPIHCAIHHFNFPFCSVLCKSVEDVTGTEIRNTSKIGNREIDVVFGGSPCQGFSVIGKRALSDPRNGLLFHFYRLITELKPKYFVLENVPGLTLGMHRQFLLEIIEKLQYSGYKVETNYQILNAANYGVPQSRARLFLLGCRQDLPLPQYPQPQTQPAKFQKSKYLVFREDLPHTPTVWDAIGDLPEVELIRELLHQDWANVKYGKSSDYSGKLRCSKVDPHNYGYKRRFNSRILTSSIRTQHGKESMLRFEQTLPGTTEAISRFHKLEKYGICNTLRAGTPSHKGSFTAPRPIHPSSPRCITVREAARLHSYPDWFRFHVTKWHGFRQVGNSVPPLLARAVATEIIRALGIIPIKPKTKLSLGNESLLNFIPSQAAQYYDVSIKTSSLRSRKKNSNRQPT